jgi:hypothetical protein
MHGAHDLLMRWPALEVTVARCHGPAEAGHYIRMEFPMQVGFVGLGRMGLNMVTRLGGHAVKKTS